MVIIYNFAAKEVLNMDNFVILQQIVAIDRAQNRFELRASIQTLLRIIGSYTSSERVYIFDRDETTGVFRNSYEWCAESVEPWIDNLQSVAPSDMPYWLKAFERGDSVIIDNVEDVKNTMPSEYNLLTMQNIHAEISFPIFFKNHLKGFIGMDNPVMNEQSESFITLLGVVGGHLGNVRETLRMTELLEQRNRSLEISLSDLEREKKFLSVLSTDYISVYCVDLELDTIEPLKIDASANVTKIGNMKPGKVLCYSNLIRSYYNKFVIKESAPDFMDILSFDHITRHLAVHGKLSYRYQVTPNAAGQEHFEAEVFPFDSGSTTKVIIGFKQIDELVAYEQNSRRQLQEALDDANLNNEIISAISKIYFSIYRIDLTQDMYEEVSSDNEVHRLTGRIGRASAKMAELCHRFVAPEYQDKILQFFDLSTISERLHTEETIAMDYLANDGNWHLARFIVKKRDQQGNVTNILYATRLISEQKRREQNWMFLAEEANTANKAKSKFLSRMAHDIQTPMNSVMGFADIARHTPDIPADVDDALSKLQTSGAYIEQLVSNILDITSLENGNQQLNEHEISVSELFQTINRIFDQELMAGSLNISFDVHDICHDCIVADDLKLKQIYANLLSNSIRFTPAGGSIKFDLYEESISGSDKIRLTARICDTGIGIKSDICESGLGLAIVKDLVDLMHGTIDVQSTVGTGTNITICVDVPYIIRDDLWSGQTSQAPDITSACAGMHLLVAEDNELNYEVMSELLGMNGITCECADNGAVCVDRFSESEPGTFNGILMDLQMPVMDGIAASCAIRKLNHPDAQSIPIIAITANAFAKDIERCHLAGMNEHLSKPLNIRQLISILSKFNN